MVTWIDDREQALAVLDGYHVCEVSLPHIRSEPDYATCLHEIGHIRGRYQRSGKVSTRERWAWQWAREHALIWTPAMEQEAAAAFN
jgi:hypothetical protein